MNRILTRRSENSGCLRHFQDFQYHPRTNHQGSKAPPKTLQACPFAYSENTKEQWRKFGELTIINLFDRIAQQAVYQIISLIVEEQMSKHSYGFRKGIGAKIPVSRLATTLNRNRDIYTVELDFKKCFDHIPLDKAIGRLKEMGIRNFQLLRTIKHLMWTSKEYSGV